MSNTETELLEKILAELKKISTQLVVSNRHPAYIIHNHTGVEKVDPRLYGGHHDPRLGG